MNSADLGKLISTHKTGFLQYWWAFLLSGILLLIPAIVWSFRSANAKNDQDVLLLCGIFVVLAIIPLIIAWYYSADEARLYESGFVYETRRSVKTVLWDEVEHIYKMAVAVNVNGITTPTQFRFSVRTKDGMIVRFSPRLKNVTELGTVLLQVAELRRIEVQSGVPYSFSRKPGDDLAPLDLK